jgi:uncharacterized protein (DUF302 family)
MENQIGFLIPLKVSYEQALIAVTGALKAEGFGVLTSIDVQATFKEKLGADFRPYSILGACNPPLSHRALSAEPEVGLMLPCNVTVESDGAGGTIVRIANPAAMLTIGPLGANPELVDVAGQARARLERVAQSLRSL